MAGNDPIKEALKDLDWVQDELENIFIVETKEMLKVKQKYHDLKKPLYDRRNGIIEKINNFWKTAILGHQAIALLINEEEKDCLKYLTKVEVEEYDDTNSYRIKLFFDANPFFENTLLVKEFQMGLINKIRSPEIQWKQGMDLTNLKRVKESAEAQSRKRRLGGGGPKSFFTWFSGHYDPSSSHDYDKIPQAFTEELWPNALSYYIEGSGYGRVYVEAARDEDKDYDGDGEDDEEEEFEDQNKENLPDGKEGTEDEDDDEDQ